MSHTDLSASMRKRADADGLPPDHELRRRAEEFDRATIGHMATPRTVDVKSFVGAWARARKAWCSYTGEPLI